MNYDGSDSRLSEFFSKKLDCFFLWRCLVLCFDWLDTMLVAGARNDTVFTFLTNYFNRFVAAPPILFSSAFSSPFLQIFDAVNDKHIFQFYMMKMSIRRNYFVCVCWSKTMENWEFGIGNN